MPEKAVDEVIEKPTRQDFSRSALQHNQEFFGYIRSDIPVSYRDAKVQLRHAFAKVPAQHSWDAMAFVKVQANHEVRDRTRFVPPLPEPSPACPVLNGAVHWHYRLTWADRMPRTKNEVLTIRTTAEVKALLKLAAERERRSAASMVEVLVLDYAKAHSLAVANPGASTRKESD